MLVKPSYRIVFRVNGVGIKLHFNKIPTKDEFVEAVRFYLTEDFRDPETNERPNQKESLDFMKAVKCLGPDEIPQPGRWGHAFEEGKVDSIKYRIASYKSFFFET